VTISEGPENLNIRENDLSRIWIQISTNGTALDARLKPCEKINNQRIAKQTCRIQTYMSWPVIDKLLKMFDGQQVIKEKR
jgi:hypothetical protein